LNKDQKTMKLAAYIQRRSGWINLSTATLVALLQRTPVLRVAAAADEFIAVSPIGALLKTAAAVVASLGAIDSMAGATILADTLDASPSGNLPDFDATVGVPITTVGFTITNTMNIASWKVTGQIPPGLVLKTLEAGGQVLTGPGVLDATSPGTTGDPWTPGTSGNNTTTPLLEGTPSTAGTYTFMLQGFAEPGEMGGNGSTFVGTGISAVFPFTVVVSNGVVVTSAPVFSTQPISVSVTGGEVALDAVASNSPTYQWMLNGAPVSGATDSTLLISDAASAAGSYTCVATNSAGSATSNPATISLVATSDPGHLSNLSARAEVGTGSNIIFGGFAIGPFGGAGQLPVLIRGSGPALVQFNVPGTLPDPQLQLFSSAGAVLETNDGWAGSATISSTAAAVGAFSWPSPTSHDAALVETLATGSYTAQIAGESGDTGDALVEIYDASPSGSFTTGATRLTNLSARVDVGTGANILEAGFVIAGDSALTVLIRASGPAISVAPFNVPGTLPDPQLTLQNPATGAVYAQNVSWGGDPEISSTAASVGAFTWSVPSSHDSALLITLPPGNYTAAAAGTSGDSGVAIVEVYEVQ
jgi:Ig-like domain-containing protein